MVEQQMGDGERTSPAGDNSPVPKQASRGSHRPSSGMDRRSWYMPAASADSLAQLVDDLHWETRQPKQAILASVVDEVLARRAQIERRIGKR